MLQFFSLIYDGLGGVIGNTRNEKTKIVSFIWVSDLNILFFFVLYLNNDFFCFIKGTLLGIGEKNPDKKQNIKNLHTYKQYKSSI